MDKREQLITQIWSRTDFSISSYKGMIELLLDRMSIKELGDFLAVLQHTKKPNRQGERRKTVIGK
jgi:hypothetical protein